jgi:endonuclease YncB( thermonuclease family)
MIVATGGGRVKVELQFIEVPEAGEQFYDTVKGHLRRMLVGKAVEFKPREILSGRVIGRVFLNNVDVSQQMLRDGAAHHVPRERSGQDKNQFDAYASTEALAKTEKRGVLVNSRALRAGRKNGSNPAQAGTRCGKTRRFDARPRRLKCPDS